MNDQNFYLSYLMGAESIKDSDLKDCGVEISKESDGSRMLKIPFENIQQYIELVKEKLNIGFWNEIIGEKEIIFIFKFKEGKVKEYLLSEETETEIDKLCAVFNNEEPEKTKNVYKYLSENSFYHDFMIENYSEMINRVS